MKAVYNEKKEIVNVADMACETLQSIETNFKFGKLFNCDVPIYYLDEENNVIERTDEEIKTHPNFSKYIDNQKMCEYENTTDNEFVRALRELLQNPDIRSKLSSETQQRVANAELQVAQIKDKYK